MDEEWIKLKKRIFLAVIVTLIFMIPIFFFVQNKFGSKTSKILNSIKHKDDIILLAVKSNCKNCQTTEKILKNSNVKYHILNKDQENSYTNILNKIDISLSNIEFPTIIYIKKGKLYSFYVKPTKKQLLNYIEINNLSSKVSVKSFGGES